MIIHGNKQISEIVYARKASDGGGAVALTNIIRGPQVVFGGLEPNVYGWLTKATRAAILAAFGQTDGKAVIKATNAYLNGIAATDKSKAQALAGFINEDPMMVCSLGLEPEGVTMPIRFVRTTAANQLYNTGVTRNGSLVEEAIVKYDKTSVRRLTGVSGSGSEYWGVTASNTFEGTTWRDGNNISAPTNIRKTYSQNNTALKFFALSDSGVYSNSGCYRGETFVYSGGVLVRQYIPFKKDGHMEFLNLLDFTLATRIGEPTEAYTRNGQPWTPQTP